MEISYTKEDIKSIIKSYYLQKRENIDVNIVAKKELTGLYETLSCVTTITLTKNTTILGRTTTTTETLSKEELINIFSELLSSEGYTLENLEYNDGINTKTVGYYMDEHTEYNAYFKGIKITASKVNTLKRKVN